MNFADFKVYMIEHDGLQHERGLAKRANKVNNASNKTAVTSCWVELPQDAKDARVECKKCFNDRLHETKYCQLNGCHYCKMWVFYFSTLFIQYNKH